MDGERKKRERVVERKKKTRVILCYVMCELDYGIALVLIKNKNRNALFDQDTTTNLFGDFPEAVVVSPVHGWEARAKPLVVRPV